MKNLRENPHKRLGGNAYFATTPLVRPQPVQRSL
jgi:hypothetical protein